MSINTMCPMDEQDRMKASQQVPNWPPERVVTPMTRAMASTHSTSSQEGAHAPTPEDVHLEMGSLKGLLGFQLRQASFLFSHLYQEHLNSLGLSPLEFSILEVVQMNTGVTAQQICNELHLRAPNAVKLIQALNEQDLIKRQPHPYDRRAFGIELTSKGRQLTTQALEHLSQLEKIGLKGLSERQKTALLRQLDRINSKSMGALPKNKAAARSNDAL